MDEKRGSIPANSSSNFEKGFKRYLYDVKCCYTEKSKAFYFLEFIKHSFKGTEAGLASKLFKNLEKYVKARENAVVVRGFVDALSGNLIIEFKTELTERELRDAKEKLRKYIWAVWKGAEKTRRYILLASDGVELIAYRAEGVEEAEKPEKVALYKIDRINLDSVKPEDAYRWLDRYLLCEEARTLISEEVSHIFSVGSPVFEQSLELLRDEWNRKAAATSSIKILYDEWQRYLRVVYGENVGTNDLFLRHTYMATLAKLMAYSIVEKIPVSGEEIWKAISGKYFDELRIQNVVGEDFFSWILRTGDDFTQKFSWHLIEHLKYFNLDEIEEDVLKGIYQELVDPKERHDLGEYYTSDWLAELMTDIIDRRDLMILDPGCGSGTFLMHAIKRKIDLGEDLEEIVSSVVGIDIHPLAVTISRVNYLLTLRSLVKKRRNYHPRLSSRLNKAPKG